MTSDKDVINFIDPKALQQLLNQGAYVIKQLQDHVTQAKKLSNQTSENCTKLLNKAYHDYLQIKMRFLRKTKDLIQEALMNPHVRYHQTWSEAFGKETEKFKQVTESVLQELDSAQKESNRLKIKYRWLLGGAGVTSTICTTLVSGLILHSLPAHICPFTVNTDAIAVVVPIALLTGSFSFAFIGSMMEISSNCVTNDQRTNEVQRLITKWFSSFDIQKNSNNKEALNKAYEKALNTLQISESIWTNKDMLQILKNEAEDELNKLIEELADF